MCVALARAGRCSGFTLVELVAVVVLLGVLGVVASARFVGPAAFAPAMVAQAAQAEARLARQLAASRHDARVSLLLDRSGGHWRLRVVTDVDGVVRTALVEAENTTVQATSGALSRTLDATTTVTVGFDRRGDLATVAIGGSAGDPALGVGLLVAGDANRRLCIHPSGYVTDDACG